MMFGLLNVLNYWAIFVATIVFWLIGALWFTVLFGNTWASLIQKHGIKVKEPTRKEMISKFIATFILNYIVVLGLAFLIYALGITLASSAIVLGLILGLCFSVATLATGYLWEGRPLTLALIDMGYPLVGIIASSLILTLWQ